MGWDWHQLDHMQIICTSLHASTSSLNFYRLDALPTVSEHRGQVQTPFLHWRELKAQISTTENLPWASYTKWPLKKPMQSLFAGCPMPVPTVALWINIGRHQNELLTFLLDGNTTPAAGDCWCTPVTQVIMHMQRVHPSYLCNKCGILTSHSSDSEA